MRTLLAICALFVPLLFQSAPTVRVRLFSAQQPSQIRVTDESGTTRLIAMSGQRLLVDGQPVAAPFRSRGTWTIQPIDGERIQIQHPLEFSVRQGQLFVIVTLPQEAYIAGVLAGEASVFRSDEALKAMAIVARSYAAHFQSRHKEEGFDFCDTTHCQDFRGNAVTERIRTAVRNTGTEVITYEGRPIDAYYHQNCGGVTEAQSPYLRQINDGFCLSGANARWTARVSRTEMQSVVQIPGIQGIEIVSRTPSGRVSRLRIVGERTRIVDAEAFRLAVGRSLGWNRIRSDLYQVRRSGDEFVFEGSGSGHGIGLCQEGAAAMGESGRSYQQILAYYYPNTVIASSPQAFQFETAGSDRADLETTRLNQDQPLLATVERLMRSVETSTGMRFDIRPLIRVYPSISAFRDNTGEPGWIAASTRGRVIRLQPPETLRSRGVLDSTLHHELAHVLIESRALPALPVWFREGLVLWLTEPPGASPVSNPVDLRNLDRALTDPRNEGELRESYRTASNLLATLVQGYGKGNVLNWLEKGLPPDLTSRLGAASQPQR